MTKKKAPQVKAVHILGAAAVLAALAVGSVVAIIAILRPSNNGVRFTAYAGECTMTITYAAGSAPEVTAKDVRGGRGPRGRGWNEWTSPDLEVPSSAKVTMKAVAHPCSKLVGEPHCVILHRGKVLADTRAAATFGECAAEATVP